MRDLTFLLVLAIIGTGVFSWFSIDRQIDIQAELWINHHLNDGSHQSANLRDIEIPFSGDLTLTASDSDHVRLALKGQHYSHVGVLVVQIDNGALYTSTQGTSANVIRRECHSKNNIAYTCRLPVRVNYENETLVTLSAKTPVATIRSLRFKTATAKRQTSVSSDELFYAYLILVFLGPFIVWTRRLGSVETYFLIALGLGWIAYAGLIGLVICVGFAVGGFAVISYLQSVEGKRPRTLVLCLFGVVLLIVFVKFLAPAFASAFANPGGFALALPLGVSYFSVKLVDLLLTAHAKELENFNLRDYFGFLFFPHTLPAGPILTYDRFQQSATKDYSITDFSAGLARTCVGLSKKLIGDTFILPMVANNMNMFLRHGSDTEPQIALFMLLANVLYVYLDFSAYSDIAIGSGRMAGRRVPENFDWPLVRGGILDFWRHWHMTLSNWVMRRVYFSAFLTSRSSTLAIMTAMMVIGLWHTPNASWLTWAVHHALAMSAETKLKGPIQSLAHALPYELSRTFAVARYIFGVVFVWIWVALGHSFTLFSDYKLAVDAYRLGLLGILGQ